MGTILSYTTLAAIAVGLTYYYSPQTINSFKDYFQTREPVASLSEQVQPKKAKQKRLNKLNSGEKGALTPTASGSEAPAAKKRKISGPVGDSVVVKTTQGNKTSIPRDDEDDLSNAEFARQLQQAQAGTKLQTTTQQGPPKKERRVQKSTPGAVQGLESPDLSAETSSAGGRDGDDDMSPVDTPPSSVSRAGDISDMLEPAAAKPNVLRLTDTESSKTKKAAPKQYEQVLSKKQRQRQRQNEENKKLVAESNKMHEAKGEKQRSAARMADGTSKQIKANNFTQNAWQPKPAQEKPAAAQPSTATLLDTFDREEDNRKEAVSTMPLNNITNKPDAKVPDLKQQLGEEKTQALAASGRERPNLKQQDSWADQLNADAQDQWAAKLVEEQQWESVTSKKSKKKGKKDTDTASEASQPVTTSVASVKPANGTSHVAKNSSTKPVMSNMFESVAGDEWEA